MALKEENTIRLISQIVRVASGFAVVDDGDAGRLQLILELIRNADLVDRSALEN